MMRTTHIVKFKFIEWWEIPCGGAVLDKCPHNKCNGYINKCKCEVPTHNATLSSTHNIDDQMS